MRARYFYVILAIVLMILFLFPINEQWMIPCLFHKFTGLDCPLCGGQRMVVALFRADFQSAFLYNPFLMCSLPLFAVWLVAYLRPSSIKKHSFLSKLCTDRIFFLYLFVALLWGICRNL